MFNTPEVNEAAPDVPIVVKLTTAALLLQKAVTLPIVKLTVLFKSSAFDPNIKSLSDNTVSMG